MPPPIAPPVVSLHDLAVPVLAAAIIGFLGWLVKQITEGLRIIREIHQAPLQLAEAVKQITKTNDQLKEHADLDTVKFGELQASNLEKMQKIDVLDKKQDEQSLKLDHISSKVDQHIGSFKQFQEHVYRSLDNLRPHNQHGD